MRVHQKKIEVKTFLGDGEKIAQFLSQKKQDLEIHTDKPSNRTDIFENFRNSSYFNWGFLRAQAELEARTTCILKLYPRVSQIFKIWVEILCLKIFKISIHRLYSPKKWKIHDYYHDVYYVFIGAFSFVRAFVFAIETYSTGYWPTRGLLRFVKVYKISNT